MYCLLWGSWSGCLIYSKRRLENYPFRPKIKEQKLMGQSHRLARTGTRTIEGMGNFGVWRGFNGFGGDDRVLGVEMGPRGNGATERPLLSGGFSHPSDNLAFALPDYRGRRTRGRRPCGEFVELDKVPLAAVFRAPVAILGTIHDDFNPMRTVRR